MKRSILILLSAAVLSLGGCKDWLDVSPGSLVDGDDLFKTETGFKQALTGAYTLVAASDLYGRNTSMMFPEALAQHWTVGFISSSSSTDEQMVHYMNNFKFDEPILKKRIATIWTSYYKVIAQLNDILEALENQPVVFYNHNDQLIKGEVIGLRAFLHLELLRLFGPIPSENRNTTGIPYVRKVTREINALQSISYGEVITRILEDLDLAESILEQYDPIIEYPNAILNNRSVLGVEGPEDEWQFLRQTRFNYYAVLGTKARLYQWIGDNAQAMEYAKMVIDATNYDGTKKFRLVTTTDMSSMPEYSFRIEHLFGVNNSRLSTNAQTYFTDGIPPVFSVSNTAMDRLFSESRVSDIRFVGRGVWSEQDYDGVGRMLCHKYTGSTTISGAVNLNLVPMLRLAEMYLIMIENLPLAEITPYLSEYIISRGLTTTLIDEIMSSESNRKAQLAKEFQKEFFAEGQMFYFYKRHETTSFTYPNTVNMLLNNYVVPMPDGQIKFDPTDKSNFE